MHLLSSLDFALIQSWSGEMFLLFHLYMQIFESGKQGERADLT